MIFVVEQKDGKKMNSVSEYIVRETGYPGAVKQEVVGELVRCKDCKWHKGQYHCINTDTYGFDADDFCSAAERQEEGEQE